MVECGFDSQKRVDYWIQQLSVAIGHSLVPEASLQRQLKDTLTREYTRLMTGNKIYTAHKGISEFTLAAIKPKLRAELDRRILASADLIKLNRSRAIEQTLQRFTGWATSIPIGGTRAEDKRETAKKIKKGIAGLSFVDRRVIIDQGHKLTSAIQDIVAVDGGAIAMRWHHIKENSAAYTPRPEHEDRDGVIYLIRDSWALKKGLLKVGKTKFTDQTTRPGQEVFCRCTGEYLYNLRDLPSEMISPKGQAELDRVQAEIARWKRAANG
jgi:hypothetical protein